jgi:hypothetical protein
MMNTNTNTNIDIHEIERTETHLKTTIEHNSSSLDALEQNVTDNSKKSKELFKNLQRMQECYESTYTNLTKEEVQKVVDTIDNLELNNAKTSAELVELCEIIRKYLTNIKEVHSDKTVYKQNIQSVLNLMYDKVKAICGFEFDEDVQIGSLYTYQLDHINQIQESLRREAEEKNCCDDIKKVKRIVTEYYSVICKELSRYTEELKSMNRNSKDYSGVLNKVYEYQLLYKRLLLYIKQYKTINREQVISCEHKDATAKDLEEYLDSVEKYLTHRVTHIYKFLMDAK